MLLFLAGAALAASPGPQGHSHDFDQMAVDGLYDRFVQFFEPNTLSADQRLDPNDWHCGTGLVLEIQERWAEFSGPQKSRMALYMSERPPLEEMEHSPEPPAMMAATETCFDAYPSKRPSWAGDGDYKIVTEHFSVEWDGSAITESKAQSFADALEHSWEVEFDEMGWRRPSSSSKYLTLAYVSGGNYAGAVTTVEYCGGDYVPYIVAGKSAFSGGTWYQDMAGHELNHASQFSYGYGHEFYFWESTATWIEEYIYPSHNAWAPYITGYSQAPHLAINKSSQQDQDIFYHMYGMAILNFYLDEYVGGPEFVEELWEYATSNGSQYDLWIGEVLEDKGYDWSEIYDGFIATNAVMDYDESAYFTEVDRVDSVNSFPETGGNSGSDKPEGYGQNYIRIKTGKASDELPDLSVSFDGANSVEWSVQLVGEVDGEITETVRLDVAEGLGEGFLSDIGQFDMVWMVVSPLTTKTKAYNYTWALDLVNANPSSGDSGDLPGLGDSGDDAGPVGGCACSSGSLGPRGLLWLGAVVPWILRRRRE